VGKTHDGTRSISSHARESHHFFEAPRKPPTVPFCDYPSGGVEIARPGVVAETFPRFAHARRMGRGQVADRRVCAEKSLVVAADSVHLGLLEHDLRDQNLVRVPRLAPWEVPAVLPEPAQKASLETPQRLAIQSQPIRATPCHG